jgi:molybdenum cofactor synthesis domain-containing protein
MATAGILTIGNELVSGDVPNTNGSWLARRLEQLGVEVRLLAAVPDEVELIVHFVRTHVPRLDVLVVTGGLGGTPDDITREALAAAFGVQQVLQDEVAEALRGRFRGDPDYVTRWADLPAGSRALENPLGGAPGFALENVYVLPGLPAEMEAMFETIAVELRAGSPIGSWRRTYRTTEGRIVDVLREAGTLHPGVVVGSYPSFHAHGGEVEVVVKSGDPAALEAAAAWIEIALDAATR